jgi:hypothetical protein
MNFVVPFHVTLQRLFILQKLLANFTLQLWLRRMNKLHVLAHMLHFPATDLALLQLLSMVAHVLPKTSFCVKNFPVQIAH